MQSDYYVLSHCSWVMVYVSCIFSCRESERRNEGFLQSSNAISESIFGDEQAIFRVHVLGLDALHCETLKRIGKMYRIVIVYDHRCQQCQQYQRSLRLWKQSAEGYTVCVVKDLDFYTRTKPQSDWGKKATSVPFRRAMALCKNRFH